MFEQLDCFVYWPLQNSFAFPLLLPHSMAALRVLSLTSSMRSPVAVNKKVVDTTLLLIVLLVVKILVEFHRFVLSGPGSIQLFRPEAPERFSQGMQSTGSSQNHLDQTKPTAVLRIGCRCFGCIFSAVKCHQTDAVVHLV